MKRHTFIAIAVLLLAACQKEEIIPTPQPQQEPATATSLAGTAWVGRYDGTLQGLPATIIWNFDLLTDSTGSILLEVMIAGQSQPSAESMFSYTFDGTEGWVNCKDFSEPFSFDYDSVAHTLTMELYIGDGANTLGGTTVFYPRGEEPQAAFPAGTVWTTEQQLTVSDTLMSVQWRLEFWDYSLGAALSYSAGGTCFSSSALWQYDSTAHTGTIRINNSQYPFSYDPTTGRLTLNYSTTLYGTDIAIGGTLQFQASPEKRWAFVSATKGLKKNV